MSAFEEHSQYIYLLWFLLTVPVQRTANCTICAVKVMNSCTSFVCPQFTYYPDHFALKRFTFANPWQKTEENKEEG
jgi:hypothetical protein